MAITVWIEEGCIVCNACDAECPDVFIVGDATSMIRGEVREDGQENTNLDARSPIKAEFLGLEDSIRAAAAGCPVEVIKVS